MWSPCLIRSWVSGQGNISNAKAHVKYILRKKECICWDMHSLAEIIQNREQAKERAKERVRKKCQERLQKQRRKVRVKRSLCKSIIVDHKNEIMR